MIELWTEKYRPKTVGEYVFTNPKTEDQIKTWIAEGSIPHLLLYGGAGTGKTTLAKVLVNELKIDGYDFLHINASRDNGVDFIKGKVEGFVQTMPFGSFKVVLLDEADYLSPNAQAIMRGLMETYQSQARFIFTCNFAHRIITPLKSRCVELQIDKSDQTEFTARAATVLVTEGVEFDLDTLDSYVKATYPDLRKCLQLLQPNSKGGQLAPPSETDSGTADYKLAAVDLFKQRRLIEARQLICSQARPEEMEEVFTWLYNNLELWGDTQEKQDDAVIIIKQGLVNHSMIADPEINLSSTLIELSRL
jgi:replication factor C small subunit